MLISEQHNALFRNLLRDLETAFHIHHAFFRRIIDYAAGKHGPQYAVNMLIQFGLGNLAGFHRFLHGVPVEDFTGFLMIQSGGGRLRSTVRSLPIRHDKTLEAPVFLQDIGQQVLVFTGIITIHPVVGAHHRGNVRLAQSNLEGQQIAFSHRPLINVDIDGVAPALLIVEGIVFYVADNVLRLFSLHHLADHLPRQDGIFAHIFEGASIARLTGQIYAPAQRHVVTLGA